MNLVIAKQRLYLLTILCAMCTYAPVVLAKKSVEGNLYVIKEIDAEWDQPSEVHFLVAAPSSNDAIKHIQSVHRYKSDKKTYTILAECKGRQWGAIWRVQDQTNRELQFGWGCSTKSAESAIRTAYNYCVNAGSYQCQGRDGISVNSGRGGALVLSPSWNDEPWGGYTQVHEWGYTDSSKAGGEFISSVDNFIQKLNKISDASNYPNYFTYRNFKCIYTSNFKEKMIQCLDKNYGK